MAWWLSHVIVFVIGFVVGVALVAGFLLYLAWEGKDAYKR